MPDRYEALELIIKVREDGESWFDVIMDYISGDCEGGGGDCILFGDASDPDCDFHDHTEILPCTCGLESAGGTTGTLAQCYKWLMPDEEWDEEA